MRITGAADGNIEKPATRRSHHRAMVSGTRTLIENLLLQVGNERIKGLGVFLQQHAQSRFTHLDQRTPVQRTVVDTTTDQGVIESYGLGHGHRLLGDT